MNNIIPCALCKQKHAGIQPDKIKEKLPINLSILNKIDRELSMDDPVSRFSISKDQQDGLNIDIPEGFKCSQHNKIVHSYVTTNNVLLCSKCLKMPIYNHAKIAPIPQIVKQLTTSLISTGIKKKECLTQLKKCTKDIEYAFEKRRDSCRSKIKTHFEEWIQKIRNLEIKVLDEFELKSDECFASMTNLFSDIDDMKEKIKGDIMAIENMLMSDNQSKVDCHEVILKLQKSHHEYYQDIDFTHKLVDINFTQDDYLIFTKVLTPIESQKMIKQ